MLEVGLAMTADPTLQCGLRRMTDADLWVHAIAASLRLHSKYLQNCHWRSRRRSHISCVRSRRFPSLAKGWCLFGAGLTRK